MNPKHVINNERRVLFSLGGMLEMSRMFMSWCLNVSGIWVKFERSEYVGLRCNNISNGWRK